MDLALRLANAGGFARVEEFGDFSLDSLGDLTQPAMHP